MQVTPSYGGLGYKDLSSYCFVLFAVSEGLQLAKASQLPEVVRAEVEARKEVGKKLREEKREQRAKLVVMHKVCVPVCLSVCASCDCLVLSVSGTIGGMCKAAACLGALQAGVAGGSSGDVTATSPDTVLCHG